MWYGRKKAGSDIAINDEGEMILNVGTPEVIKLPPELGRHAVSVLSTFIDKCPFCNLKVKHYELDVSHLKYENLYVAECSVHNFLWYAKS
jgi:hypothetical protein